MLKPKKRKYRQRPVIKITSDHLSLAAIIIAFIEFIVSVAILISIWAVKG